MILNSPDYPLTNGVQVKILTFTSPAVNSSVNVAHGLLASNILSFEVVINGVPQCTKGNTALGAGYEYEVRLNGNNFVVYTTAANSANVASVAGTIVVTYSGLY